MKRVIKKIVCRADNFRQSSDCVSVSGMHHPEIIQSLYRLRGVKDAADINYTLSTLPRPDEIPNMALVCKKLASLFQQRTKITIVGDYDVDGATATSLLVAFLQHCRYPHDYFIPDRFEYGYGLSEKIVDELHQKGCEAILTVDNGISSVRGVARANALNLPVLITDHHLPPETLPDTPYLLNPSLDIGGEPHNQSVKQDLKALAGVGVVFYLLMAFRQHLREIDWFKEQGISEPNLAQYLDLVALGTVADVVPLLKTNRTLVAQGLSRIRSGQCRAGIRALFAVAGKDISLADADDIGFAIAPRLNAAGRLKQMDTGVECLTTDDDEKAFAIARSLDETNQQRKSIQKQMQDEAQCEIHALNSMVSADFSKNAAEKAENPQVTLSIFQPHWHQGVTGLIAGQLKEIYHKPVAAFACESELSEADLSVFENSASAEKNGGAESNGAENIGTTKQNPVRLKGSCRSVENIHIKDVLSIIDNQHPDLLLAYGGHAMAAGLSINYEAFDKFKLAFEEATRLYYVQNDMPVQHAENDAVYLTDFPLKPEHLSLSLVDDIQRAGPWGQGFPSPVFSNNVVVHNVRMLNGGHLKLQVIFAENETGEQNPLPVDAICFRYNEKYAAGNNDAEHSNETCSENGIKAGDEIRIAYQLSRNIYMDNVRLQLIIHEINQINGKL